MKDLNFNDIRNDVPVEKRKTVSGQGGRLTPESIEYGNANIYAFDLQKQDFLPILQTDGHVSDDISKLEGFGVLPQPASFRLMSDLSWMDSTQRASIKATRLMVSGLGFRFNNEKKYNKQLKEAIKNPADNVFETFHKIIKDFTSDYTEFYNGFIAFRKKVGEEGYSFSRLNARDMFPVPRKKGGEMVGGYPKKWAQITPNSIKPKFYTPYTGQENIIAGKNYVAHLWTGNSKSSFMGLPDYYPALTAMIENILIRRYGLKYFRNDTRPNFAIIMTGGKLNPDQKSMIAKQLEQHQGVDNKHKTLIISIEDSSGKIELKELSQKIDGDFLKERDANRDEIARTWLIPPKLIGISAPGSLGSGSESIGSLKVFVELVVKPMAIDIQDFFNILLSTLYNQKDVDMVLNTMDLTSAKDDAVIYSLLSKIIAEDGVAAITPAEIRKLKKFDEKQNGKPAVQGSISSNSKGDARTNGNTDESGNKTGMPTTEGEDGED